MTAQTASYTGAWRWGLLFGSIAVVLTEGVSLLFAYLFPGANGLVGNLIGIVLSCVSLLLCGYAGYVAARKSGSPYTGNSAGLYAGVVYAIISEAIALLLLYERSDNVRHFMLLYTISFGCSVLIYGVLALVAGVIGGKIAQHRMTHSG